MSELSSIEITFKDLEDVHAELSQTQSPKQVRQNFVRFIEGSQKLTAMTHREYKEKLAKAGRQKTLEAGTTLQLSLRNSVISISTSILRTFRCTKRDTTR